VFRNCGLQQFLVHRLATVMAVTHGHVLACHFSRMQSLGWLTIASSCLNPLMTRSVMAPMKSRHPRP
jgi:hypothetical protein